MHIENDCKKQGLGALQSSRKECVIKNLFSNFSTKTYFVGTQKNRLNEMFFFEHPKHMFKMADKKRSQF